jgi:alkanesulfonate monooxygenase SsuD/methylene tetrahydromethanopterin reductase-like flavin-dependent oxidoreductase (luciferase family)
VALTVGAGWMREEFELLGQSFGNRGKRLDEMIPALRALWQGAWVGTPAPGTTQCHTSSAFGTCAASTGGATNRSRSCSRLVELRARRVQERAEDLGVTAVVCAPWMGTAEAESGQVAQFRGPIERFAETVIAKLR